MSGTHPLHSSALGAAGAQHRMLIGGTLISGGASYPVLDPSTAATIAAAPDATAAEVDAAVHAADAAAAGWSAVSPADRAAVVRAMADTVEDHLDDIAALDSLDTGVPLWMMRRDVGTGIARMRMFADWALRLTGETIPAIPSHLTYTERIPFGVVARIVAYNHPAMFAISKVAAPLVAGNTVVLKPSDLTPLSTLRLAELWADLLPAGVLAVLTGAGAETGRLLVADPRIRRVAFTGSPGTGRAIQRAAAEAAVKSVSLELGGKNAIVVLPSADLELVVDGAVKGMNFAFAGQSCGSTSRVFVPRDRLAELVERLEERVASVRPGMPFADGTGIGPLISGGHRDRVHAAVAAATTAGARLVAGGRAEASLGDGYFFQPTLIVDDDPASPLATEEIFGPVLTVIPTESTERSIELANAVRYGLTASVYGNDLDAAMSTAGSMMAGYVWVNDTSTHFPGVPFGGVKESGVGREESFEELLGYTQLRATSVRRG